MHYKLSGLFCPFQYSCFIHLSKCKMQDWPNRIESLTDSWNHMIRLMSVFLWWSQVLHISENVNLWKLPFAFTHMNTDESTKYDHSMWKWWECRSIQINLWNVVCVCCIHSPTTEISEWRWWTHIQNIWTFSHWTLKSTANNCSHDYTILLYFTFVWFRVWCVPFYSIRFYSVWQQQHAFAASWKWMPWLDSTANGKSCTEIPRWHRDTLNAK